MTICKAYFDGACEPVNPKGVATWGFAVKNDGRIVHTACGLAGIPFAPEATNNLAEYTALVRLLEWLKENHIYNGIIVHGDSQLVINQVNGIWKAKSPAILPLCHEAKGLLSDFDDITLQWVPRDENTIADELSKKAFRQYMTLIKR